MFHENKKIIKSYELENQKLESEEVRLENDDRSENNFFRLDGHD